MNTVMIPRQPLVGAPQAVYAILESPRSHPGKWVVQLWNPTPVGHPIAVVDGLLEAQVAVLKRHPNAVRCDRQRLDAPDIVETWA